MDTQAPSEELVVPLLIRVAEDVGLVQQVVAQRLGEIGARERSPWQRLHPRRQHEVLAELLGFGLGDLAFVDEPFEHLDPAGATSFGFVDRVETRRRSNEAGQERRLDEREVGRRLAEVGLGGCFDPVGVVAEEHRVQVARHDVLLRHLVLEHPGVVHLKQLVPPVALQPGEEVVLRHLHRDGRSPLLG